MAEELPPEEEGEVEEVEEEEEPEYEDVDDVDTPNEKLLRISRVDMFTTAESYRNNTKKEDIMLEYVANFRRQFEDLYPKRTALMLCPRNECGVRKFICTSVRPTQVPFQDVYDHDKCAALVSDFIKYEPLELQTALPQHMPSPTAVLGWQAGDCFDMAQVLCSLLLGVGYDAYVVSGYAPRVITLCDQSATAFPSTDTGAKKAAARTATTTKYKIRPLKTLESQFLKQKEEREKARAAAAARSADEGAADTEIVAAAEAEELDELKGRRVHAWVLVLAGKRMLEESVFLEPSTGIAYSVEHSPYYGVESLWNASNYWVNTQGDKPPASMSFDLANLQKWEQLLVDKLASPLDAGAFGDDPDDPEAAARATAAAEAEKKEEEEEAAGAADGAEEKVLMEMPPSWPQRLDIPRDRFESRCPSGSKTVVYRKGRLEKFAPYSRADGLVTQLTVYADARRSVLSEVRQTFALRKDKLAMRIRYVAENRTREIFEPGRPRGLREHVLIEGVRRELHFNSPARLDGLMTRVEEFGKKTVQTYDGSKDALVYRSVSYRQSGISPTDTSPEASLRKMTEKFRRDESEDAEEDVCKRTFELVSGGIKVIYHYGHDRVTCSFRHYSKDGTGHVVVQVDPFSRPPADGMLLEEFQKLQAAERDCLNEVRDAERQAKDLLKKRAEEEAAIEETIADDAEAAASGRPKQGKESKVPPHLVVSVYDTQRHKYAEQEETEEEKAASQVPHDYLTPFLPHPIAVNDPPLAKDDAFQARDGCLKALKERLVERANIVQSRLDEENAALSKRQAAFQRNRDHMDPNDEAEYERYCQEAMFRIQILEQRLDRHTELSLQKYAEMDARLRSDPRLAKLSHG